MISQIVMIIALISIWLSLAWGLVILFSAVHFGLNTVIFVSIRIRFLIIQSDHCRTRP